MKSMKIYFGEQLHRVAMFVALAVVLLYSISSNLFYHSHFMDGQWILHSHLSILEQGEEQSHTHTAQQVTAIELLASSLVGGFVLLVLIAAVQIVLSEVITLSEGVVELSLPSASGRAPPIFN